jgi:hypothetical protein
LIGSGETLFTFGNDVCVQPGQFVVDDDDALAGDAHSDVPAGDRAVVARESRRGRL